MPEQFTLSPEVEAELGTLGSVELAVVVNALERPEEARTAIAAARAGLGQRFQGMRAVVLHLHGGTPFGEVGDDPAAAPVLNLLCRTPGAAGTPWPRASALRLAFEASRRLGARAIAVVGAEVASLTPEWIGRLLDPVLGQGQHLVTPHYRRHPYAGAVTSGLIYPLIRTLYGRRLRYPLGPELGCSARLVELQLRSSARRTQPGPQSVELQLLAEAVAGGLGICQAALGPRTLVAGDGPAGLTGVLQEVLAQVFAEMERSTATWQKVRGSAEVTLSGSGDPGPIEPVALERKRLVDAFRLGQQNLQDVWGLALPPSTLVELKKMARPAEGAFSMPDRLWARIAFDFSLAFRTRVMNRDHLMGALTPLYLGWLGSLHTELGDAEPAVVEDRLETLCLHFEAEKPYLISRWRWPDRFIP